MANIELTVNGHQYPPLEDGFSVQNLDNATDVETLNTDVYTDFSNNNNNRWTIPYETLTKEQYDLIRADYDDQFITNQYPLISIPYYGVEDRPARMRINEKNLYNDCGMIKGVEITFRETSQLPEGS